MLRPESAQAVFDHISHDPVRGEQLRDSRDLFFGNLSFFGEGGVLGLCVVILVQPADDLDLSAASYVKVLLRNVIDQMIDYAILIDDRQVQQ